jgi:hypothetical protein
VRIDASITAMVIIVRRPAVRFCPSAIMRAARC